MENITSKSVKSMSTAQLEELCARLREEIIATVVRNGGHLASNLGAVELTVALHYVFDFPHDKLIFDVGHQCYPHKLLTGRGEAFDTLRRRGGLSGFPKREESEYDAYNVGHAGTSVSAALGMAKARDITGEDYNVIALIGDGSFNNGLIYEAFNSLRPLNTNILVILNDNGMSISPTVGSMHEYLQLLSEDDEQKRKRLRHANIFERFGFVYEGVFDGNDLPAMIEKLTEIKQKLRTSSVILHVATKKGKGYDFCEEHPEETHGVSRATGSPAVEYSAVLGRTLCDMAERDNRIVAVTAAMTSGLGLGGFFAKYPQRAIDVGICEEHATILCAALATQDLKPYYAVYSTFLQRSYDEIVLDICSQNLPVTLCVDRAGVSGADGETHQGVFDLSFLNSIPNLTVAVPKDVEEFKRLLEFSVQFNAPLAIRYPRAGGALIGNHAPVTDTSWETLRLGNADVAIVACGERMLSRADALCEKLQGEGVNVTLINARFVKPLDTRLLDSLPQSVVVTMEDGMLLGGFGSLVALHFADGNKKVKNFAYRDEFIPHGGVDGLIRDYGVDMADVERYIKKYAYR